MIEKIKKLLDSSCVDDVILAMELMLNHLTIEQIRSIKLSRRAPFKGHIPVAFKISKKEYVIYNNDWLWITEQPVDTYGFKDYLGEHPELKNKENVQD